MDQQPESEKIYNSVKLFLEAQTLNERQNIVVHHPELLSNEGVELMKKVAAFQNNDGARQDIFSFSILLRRCAEIGIDQAFSEVKAQYEPQIPNGVIAILQAVTQAEQSEEFPRNL